MGDRFPRFVAAAVQAAPVFLDREATIEKACRLVEEAGQHGADIIAFPECFVPGFPHWFDFVPYHQGLPYLKELFANAVEVPSEATAQLCAAARRAHAYVVVGINEREPGSLGTLYNTMLFIGPQGELLGRHRKLVPTTYERLVHGNGDGSDLRVFPTEFGELGGLICGENTNSLFRFALLAKGEKIHVASWPAFQGKAHRIKRDGIAIRARYHAYEGRVFVISSTGVFSQEMTDRLCETAEQRAQVECDGGYSSIIGPNGQYLAGPLEEGESILYAECDLGRVVEEKFLHDLVGHYNRFDVVSLRLNERSPRPLEVETLASGSPWSGPGPEAAPSTEE